MAQEYLEDREWFRDVVVEGYRLEEYKGHGEMGVVYRAVCEDIQDTVACKLVPAENLRKEWKIELQKVNRLAGVPQVVPYQHHGTVEVKGKLFVFVFWQYISGQDLRHYVEDHPSAVTLDFIQYLADEILQAFYAMQRTTISHDDLHEGNILIADDPRIYGGNPTVKITDFGTPRWSKSFVPKDDYESLARICYNLLSCIDPSTLDGKSRFIYERFISFLNKEVIERDFTIGAWVRNPDLLIKHLRGFSQEYEDFCQQRPKPTLKHPFDYWSCEQIGEDFELLSKLYSLQFLGNRDLVERTNTVLTGPRGCGKTTIFRNLSLKTQLLSKKQEATELGDYIGVYYQCKDLYYAFPYLKEEPTPEVLQITVHYFDLALLLQILDTLLTMQEVSGMTLSAESFALLEGFIKLELPNYQVPPAGTSKLRHMLSTVQAEKLALKRKLESGQYAAPSSRGYLGLDFLKQFCKLLWEAIPWLKNRPFYFFLDDYSLPKISKPLQLSLNRIVFDRCAECFFKVSTESVVSLYPYDADGKLLDEAREYDLIDLGDYFLLTTEREDREKFLLSIINNRLDEAEGIHPKFKRIENILGETPYDNNKLARRIAAGEHVYYHGIDTLVDLCSGDIANILKILRDIFAQVGGPEAFSKQEGVEIPIGSRIQDKVIREFGNGFLNSIESFPEGSHLREIVEAFGEVANYYLCNRISTNVDGRPQWQAFRMEMRDNVQFDDAELEKYYNDLVRYSVFIRDVRGKSQRGAVVPRLYLRRILIPTFRLTFSHRDSIGLEVKEFNTLLRDPGKFVKIMKVKSGIPEEQRRML
jgi:hypothetical protein